MATSILVVEDSRVTRAQIIAELRKAALFDSYYEAVDGVEGLKVLAAGAIDFIVCDLMMPNMDGLTFLEVVKGKTELRDIPIVMLSAQEESALKIKALHGGASDYITKPFNPGELVARIMVHLKVKALQDEMRKANELLKELSITDHLTHLYNRRYMMDMLEMEFERARRNKGNLCLILIDVDHFKLVNDTYGHQQGDIVLAAVAEVIQAEIRCYDKGVRYGGEEFAVILPGNSLQDGVAVAERVRQAVLSIAFPSPIEYLSIT